MSRLKSLNYNITPQYYSPLNYESCTEDNALMSHRRLRHWSLTTGHRIEVIGHRNTAAVISAYK